MSIGTGVVLFVIGAILVFALNFDIGGVVNIDVIGYILMAAGAVVFVIGLVALFRRRSAVLNGGRSAQTLPLAARSSAA